MLVKPGRRGHLEQSYPAHAETVVRARRTVGELARAAGATPAELERITLAVSEATTNAVKHAYAYSATPGMVHVTATVIAGELTVLIADDGCGPRAPARDPGLGLGWKLIARVSDAFTITPRGDGGTVTRFCFRLARAHTGGPVPLRGPDAAATAPA